MSDLTINIRDFKHLTESVMPFASDDVMLPVLNCVRVESRGSHLMAMSTDRFRLACKRLAAPEGTTWPEWSATIPLATLRSLFQTYKAKRFAEPVITLKVDGEVLAVHGDDALVDLLDASVSYPLSDGTFPKVGQLFREAIQSGAGGSEAGFNPAFLADFSKVGPALAVRFTAGDKKPVLFADGEDFIALLMPRRLVTSDNEGQFPSLDSWGGLLADEAPKKRARKGAAA
jgi:DNA polymerase III sliding clamp (beta) subunit (PCNA family)